MGYFRFTTTAMNQTNNNQFICKAKELWELRSNKTATMIMQQMVYLFLVKYYPEVFTLSRICSFCFKIYLSFNKTNCSFKLCIAPSEKVRSWSVLWNLICSFHVSCGHYNTNTQNIHQLSIFQIFEFTTPFIFLSP